MRPVILSDNVFNQRIYPGHLLTASSTASEKSVGALASGRRIRRLGGWAAATPNSEASVTSTFDQLRAFDLLWSDRDHNLASQSLGVRISDDGFTTYQTIGPKTVPSAPTPMSALFDGEIVMTDEGALLWWLDLQVGHAVQVFIPAMGAGLVPELAGLAVGLSFRPARAPQKPDVFGKTNLTHSQSRSESAQDASGELGAYRSQDLVLLMDSWDEYLTALYPLQELFIKRRKPTVVIPDDEQAERAALTMAPPGSMGFEVPEGQFLPEIRIPWEETQPELVS